MAASDWGILSWAIAPLQKRGGSTNILLPLIEVMEGKESESDKDIESSDKMET